MVTFANAFKVLDRIDQSGINVTGENQVKEGTGETVVRVAGGPSDMLGGKGTKSFINKSARETVLRSRGLEEHPVSLRGIEVPKDDGYVGTASEKAHQVKDSIVRGGNINDTGVARAVNTANGNGDSISDHITKARFASTIQIRSGGATETITDIDSNPSTSTPTTHTATIDKSRAKTMESQAWAPCLSQSYYVRLVLGELVQ